MPAVTSPHKSADEGEDYVSMNEDSRPASMSHGSLTAMRGSVSSPLIGSEGRKLDILQHREVFKWLPVAYSNDLVHGAMWFVYASLLSIFIPIVPLCDMQWHFFKSPDSQGLSTYNEASTWILLFIAGVFFTIGSIIWVRSFYQPHIPGTSFKPCITYV